MHLELDCCVPVSTLAAPCRIGKQGKAKNVYKLARLELGRFVRIVTGHNNLSFFQTKIGLFNRATCRFCLEGQETITHLTTDCPRFVTARAKILRNEIPMSGMKWSVRALLDFSYLPGLIKAFEGSWASGDPPLDMDESFGLGWLEHEPHDENNNERRSLVHNHSIRKELLLPDLVLCAERVKIPISRWTQRLCHLATDLVVCLTA